MRLAREGYPVWCDLTKLLGGEDFWSDIEDAIRNRTTKFLFVLSKTSNEKPGVLQELALAKRVGKEREDFVIPLIIDDLASDETTIELPRLNSIDFRGGWVGGLAKLLEKLEKDGVPKGPRFNAAAVATWWQDNLYSGQADRPQRAAGLQLVSDPVVSSENFPPLAARREEEARSASTELSIPPLHQLHSCHEW